MSINKKRDFLYELIQQMSSSEKRYFKIRSEQHTIGSKNNYCILFDIISNAKESLLSEEEIKKSFVAQTSKKRFDLYKANLYKKILESLEQYHKDRDVNDKIRSMGRQIAILNSKNLPEQVRHILRQAKKLCFKHEKWYQLLDLLAVERSFNYAQQEPQLENDIEQKIISKVSNVCSYRSLQSQMWKLYVKNGLPTDLAAIESYDEVGKQELIQNESDAISLESKCIRLYLLQFYSGMKMDLKATCKWGAQLVKLIEENRELGTDKSELYIRSLINLQYAQIRLERYKDVLENIAKCRAIIFDLNVNPSFRQAIMLSLYINEYDALQKLNPQETQSNLIDDMRSFYNEQENSFSEHSKYLYYWQNAIHHFNLNEYDECQNWTEKINISKSEIRSDIQTLARLLTLIIHFELGNEIVLKYSTINTFRYLKNKNKLDHLENTLIRFIKKELSKSNRSKKQRLASFVQLRKDWQFIENNNQSHEALKLYNIFNWINSKIDYYKGLK